MRLESLAKKASVSRALRQQSSLETTTLPGTYVKHVFEVCLETAGEDSTAVRDRVVAASETKVARFPANRATCIADRIDTPHVAEALQYRRREGD